MGCAPSPVAQEKILLVDRCCMSSEARYTAFAFTATPLSAARASSQACRPSSPRLSSWRTSRRRGGSRRRAWPSRWRTAGDSSTRYTLEEDMRAISDCTWGGTAGGASGGGVASYGRAMAKWRRDVEERCGYFGACICRLHRASGQPRIWYASNEREKGFPYIPHACIALRATPDDRGKRSRTAYIKTRRSIASPSLFFTRTIHHGLFQTQKRASYPACRTHRRPAAAAAAAAAKSRSVCDARCKHLRRRGSLYQIQTPTVRPV